MALRELLARVRLCWCLAVLLLGNGGRCQSTVVKDLSGFPGRGYSLEIGLGTPPQLLRVILDTGSSNFAVASANHSFINAYFHTARSSSYKNLGTSVSVTYTEGFWRGDLVTDKLTISPFAPLVVQLETIDESKDFFVNGADWQGILGLAYPSLAKPSSAVTPVFDSLVQSGTVSSNMFSMQLCGTIDKGRGDIISTGGKLVMDGISSSLYTGDILYTPLQRTGYYEVAMSRVEVNGVSLGFECKEYNDPRTIVDSGTTGLRFPTAIYNSIVTSLREYAVKNIDAALANCPNSDGFWQNSDACCILPEQSGALFRGFPNITITLPLNDASHREFVLTVPSQLYLQAVPANKAVRDCYKFFVLPSDYGSVLGAVLMEGYYVVFDRENKQIGFATSTCQVGDLAFQKPALLEPSPVKSNASCLYISTNPTSNTTSIAIGVGVGFGILLLIVVLAVFLAGRTTNRNAESGYSVSRPTEDPDHKYTLHS